MADHVYTIEVIEDDNETLYVRLYDTRVGDDKHEHDVTTLVTSQRVPAISDAMHFAGTELAAIMGDHWY